jgi:hypothetical protein
MVVAAILRPDPQLEIRPASHGARHWQQSAEVASFTEREPGVLSTQVHLADFAVADALWLHPDKYVVELHGVKGTPREGQGAVCFVEPLRREATLETAPVDLADIGWTDLSVHVGPGSGSREGSAVPVGDLEEFIELVREGEISRRGGVSRDGRWVAAIPADAREPRLCFVDLSIFRP